MQNGSFRNNKRLQDLPRCCFDRGAQWDDVVLYCLVPYFVNTRHLHYEKLVIPRGSTLLLADGTSMFRERQHRGMVNLMSIDPMSDRLSKIHIAALPLTGVVSLDGGLALPAPTDKMSKNIIHADQPCLRTERLTAYSTSNHVAIIEQY